MLTFGMPEVLLLIAAEDLSVVVNEVGYIYELIFTSLVIFVRLDDRPREDAYFAFFGK